MFLNYSKSKFDKFGYYILGSLIIIIFNFLGQIPLTIAFASTIVESNIEIKPDANPMDLLKAIPSNLRLFLMLFPFAFSFIGVWLVSNKIHGRTITNYFTRLYAFRWREAMTFAYMPYWKKVDTKVEGASQRIQEDCMNFAKIVESIGLQIVRAIMLLIAFIPILWGLSSNVIVHWLKDINL